MTDEHQDTQQRIAAARPFEEWYQHLLKCTPLSRPKLALHKLSCAILYPSFSDTLPLASDSPAPGVTARGYRT